MIFDLALLGVVALTSWALGRLRGISMGHNEAITGLVHMPDGDYRRAVKAIAELRMEHRLCREGVCDVPGERRPSGM